MKKFTFFWKIRQPGEIYSQWYIRSFTLDGITFNCAEQYMMWKKAMLFGDKATAAKILAEPKPEKQKELGRSVRPFDTAIWDKACYEIVKAGNLAKFQQNPDLAAELKSTAPTTLVEASPVDRIWGIGLAADHPDAQGPTKWRGKNLLGKVLTEVRDLL